MEAGGSTHNVEGNLLRQPGLAEIMAGLAAGDMVAFTWLIEVHRGDLERTVRKLAADRYSRLSAEDVDELVIETALAIQAVARGWRADRGAPPWVWARGRISAAVDRHLSGRWVDELDDERQAQSEEPPARPAVEEDTSVHLRRLASKLPEVALLCEGLERVASARDQVVFMELGIQVALGDPSPAVTVGALFGMNPASVRQQSRRTRLRLRALAQAEPRFGPLADLAVVA